MGLIALLVEIVPRLVALASMVELLDISPLRDIVQHQWWAWLPLLGFAPAMITTMISLSLVYQFWIHNRTL